ncbi:MAG TPA: amidase family protein, partial [Longimicrobiaceae bacterium]|nr:amidase family protein [Longimicrobiaceae bacterium]
MQRIVCGAGAQIVTAVFPLVLLAQQPGEAEFRPQEATIARIHSEFASGQLTCVDLIRKYLARIEAFDDEGPTLNAILHVNARAMDEARELDGRYLQSDRFVGPLHCVPVILKDNVDTADMPTTGGSVTLAGSIPPDDAFLVTRLKAAGA